MNEFQDLIPDFLDESHEHLANIEDDILVMESAVNQGEKTDDEVINRIFRAIHSIKGGSSFVGFSKIEELSHKMEDLLNFIRNGDIIPQRDTIDVLLKSIDKLTEMLEDAMNSNSADVSGYVGELIDVTNKGLGKDVRKSVETIVNTGDAIEGVDFSVSKYTLERKLDKGNVYIIKLDTFEHVELTGKNIIDFISDFVSFGEILDSQIDIENISEDHLPINFLYFTVMDHDIISASLPSVPSGNIITMDKDKLATLFSDDKKIKSSPKAKSVEESEPERDGGFEMNEDVVFESMEEMASEEDNSSSEILERSEKSAAEALPEFIMDDGDQEEETEWDKFNEFVTFYIGEEQYAVPIFMVQEIKEMQPFSDLPNQPGYVIGVINLRGNVVPIFDMRSKLGLESKEFDKFTVVLLINLKGKLKGCVVDAINDVIVLEQHDKQATPMFARSIRTEYIKFIGKDPTSESFIIILDMENILQGD